MAPLLVSNHGAGQRYLLEALVCVWGYSGSGRLGVGREEQQEVVMAIEQLETVRLTADVAFDHLLIIRHSVACAQMCGDL